MHASREERRAGTAFLNWLGQVWYPAFSCADKVGWVFTFAAAAYNLVRMRNLLASPVGAA